VTRLERRADRAICDISVGRMEAGHDVTVAVRHDHVARLTGRDALATDDAWDLDYLALDLRERGFQPGALPTTRRVAKHVLVDGRRNRDDRVVHGWTSLEGADGGAAAGGAAAGGAAVNGACLRHFAKPLRSGESIMHWRSSFDMSFSQWSVICCLFASFMPPCAGIAASVTFKMWSVMSEQEGPELPPLQPSNASEHDTTQVRRRIGSEATMRSMSEDRR
jgi:hypothetical protein